MRIKTTNIDVRAVSLCVFALVMSAAARAEMDVERGLLPAENGLMADPQQFSLGSRYSLVSEGASAAKATGAPSEADNAGTAVNLASVTLDESIPLSSELPLLRSLPTDTASHRSQSSSVNQNIGLKPGDAVFLLPQKYFKHMPETDLVALEVKGANEWELLNFADLDAAFGDEGERYIPLIRLLNATGLAASTSGETLTFRSGAGDEVELNLAKSLVAVNGELTHTDFVAGVSDITLQREIYLPPKTIATIFGFDVQWDDLLYQYIATTSDSFPVWDRRFSRLIGRDAVSLPADNLPSMYDAAQPDSPLVGFVEAKTRIGFDYRSEGSVATSTASSSIKLWGNAWDGQYRMRMELPTATYSNNSGFDTGERNLLVPSQFQWKRDGDSSQLTVGDVGLALSDLALPSTSMTGVRFSGVGSVGGDFIDARRSQYGAGRRLVSDKIYSGTAEIGSVVSLVVNDRVVESIKVVADSDAPLGYGRYEFNEISIGGGSRSEIRIDILEPSGALVSIDKESVSSNRLLPKGGFSYLGGIGTRRDYREWGAEGVVGGARILYGVTPRVTLGLSAGYQQGVYENLGTGTVSFSGDQIVADSFDIRGLPDSSLHIGSEVVAQVLPNLLLSGDFAVSSGENDLLPNELYEGSGMRLLADWAPTRRIKLRSQWFHYDRGFYNGSNNNDTQDREGYSVNLSLPKTRWFGVSGGAGYVKDNLDGMATTTNAVSFQNLNVSSNFIPYTSFRVGANYLQPDEGKDRTSIEVNSSISLPYVNLGFKQTSILGSRDNGSLINLVRGVNIPGLQLNTTDTRSVHVNFRLPENHRLSSSWVENDGGFGNSTQRIAVNHSWSGIGLFGLNEQLPGWFRDRRLSISTTLDIDTTFDEREIRTFIGIPLRTSSRSSLRLSTSYNDKRGVYFGFDLELDSLFSPNNGTGRIGLTRVPDYFNPNYGGIQGVVYLDLNANAIRDPGEPGLSDIGIISSADGLSITSDSKGKFLIGKRPDIDQSQLYLDVKSVPANLKPTHGMQMANLLNGGMTKLDFGLAPVISVSGVIKAQKRDADGEFRPMSGARVFVLDREGNLAQESISASDGSYYLDVLPGEYSLKIDPDTVQSQYILEHASKALIVTGSEEYQELDLPPMYAKLLSPAEMDRMKAYEEGKFWDLGLPLIRDYDEILKGDVGSADTFSRELLIFEPIFDI